MRILMIVFMIILPFNINLLARQLPVRLGDTTVWIVQEKQGRGKSFIHLHQNETTALKAARAVVEMQGGQILTLVHPGQRNISFHLHHRLYQFDPNRMFTENGIRASLIAGGQYSDEAYWAVKRLADTIKALLPPGKIIAVHNNETYSLRDYLPGNPLEKDARQLTHPTNQYFRNFYLVTRKIDFDRLSELRFNSVWQAKQATDDGSLSIYLSNRHYVNVEAGYDQLDAQILMLKYA